MANEIKQYQRLTYVNLKDGRTLTTDKTPEEVYAAMYNEEKDSFGPFNTAEEGEEFFRYVYDLI